jgi:hypothetical protein
MIDIDGLQKKVEKLADKETDLTESSEELAEMILDKIHLSMTKENPDWQSKVLETDSEQESEEVNGKLRQGFNRVVNSNKIILTPKMLRGLAKEFYSLGCDPLGRYCQSRANYIINKVNETIKGTKRKEDNERDI